LKFSPHELEDKEETSAILARIIRHDGDGRFRWKTSKIYDRAHPPLKKTDVIAEKSRRNFEKNVYYFLSAAPRPARTDNFFPTTMDHGPWMFLKRRLQDGHKETQQPADGNGCWLYRWGGRSFRCMAHGVHKGAEIGEQNNSAKLFLLLLNAFHFLHFKKYIYKTQLQLQSNAKGAKLPYNGMISGLTYTVRTTGFLSLYRGLAPTLLGSIPKAGIRFGLNAVIKDSLRDKNGNLTPAKNFLAGLGAGVAEALCIVAPVETVKTKVIELNKPFVEGFKYILKTEGAAGVYKGVSGEMSVPLKVAV
jgi:hypothetical protein